jgi:hypothetical protein
LLFLDREVDRLLLLLQGVAPSVVWQQQVRDR